MPPAAESPGDLHAADAELAGARRGAQARLAVGVAISGLATMLVLVLAEWQPLLALDSAILVAANALVAGSPRTVQVVQLVSDIGSWRVGVVVYPVAVAWLLVRLAPRSAAYLVIAGLGALVLDDVVKVLVARSRPVVDVVVATASGTSFPSGHAMGTTITCGALLRVFLPVIPPALHRWAVTAGVALTLVVGATRVLLGVHHPSDVIAGWALGVCWLSVTALSSPELTRRRRPPRPCGPVPGA